MGHGEVQSFCTLRRCDSNICLGERKNQTGRDGEENKNHNDINHFFSSSILQKKTPLPFLTSPQDVVASFSVTCKTKGIFPPFSGFGVCCVCVLVLKAVCVSWMPEQAFREGKKKLHFHGPVNKTSA